MDFADIRDGVDERNLGRQESIGGMLDEFGTGGTGHHQPRRNARTVRSRNSGRRSSVRSIQQRLIRLGKQIGAARTVAPQHDSVGIEEIRDRAAFPQKLGIGSHTETRRLRPVALQHTRNPLVRADGHSALHHHQLEPVDRPRDLPAHGVQHRHVGFPVLTRRRPDGDEHHAGAVQPFRQ